MTISFESNTQGLWIVFTRRVGLLIHQRLFRLIPWRASR